MSEERALVIRETVSAVSGRDFSGVSETDVLDLDSIHRITLIVELENIFGIVIDNENLVPEVFETFGSLIAFVEGMRSKDEI